MGYKSDIEIAQETEMLPIGEIAKIAGIDEKYLEYYGRYKAKIDYNLLKEQADRPDGKLILVTAINPTPAGEGKTTTTVGLADGLRKIGQERDGSAARAVAGPGVRHQGRRGRRRLRPGRSHGGHQPAFYRRFPCHRRGQQPAGGHAGQPYPAGQRPGIDTRKITWKRVVDMNDRQLRNIVDGLGGKRQRRAARGRL